MPPLPLTAVFDDLPDPRRETAQQAPPPHRHPGHRHLCRHRRGRVLGGDRRVRPHQGGVLPPLPPAATTASPAPTPSSGSSPSSHPGRSPGRSAGGWRRRARRPAWSRSPSTASRPGGPSGTPPPAACTWSRRGPPRTAWSSARPPVADGSNEIAAIPELLRTLDLAGAIVTIDAAGCQVENARIIREREGHYLLAVKDNQPTLRAAVEAVFDRACEADFVGVRSDGHEEVEDGHGRHEERYVTVIYDPAGLPPDWPDVAAVVQVNREREVGGERTATTPLLPHQLRRHGGGDRRLGPGPLGHRERAALGPRRGLPRGPEPGPGRGTPGPTWR